MSSYHMAIDIGAGSGRAVVGRIEENGLLRTKEIHRFSTESLEINNSKHINIYNIFQEVVHAMNLFAKRYDSELGSIGIDTWATDYGILNPRGELYGLPYFYRDRRTDGIADRIEEKISKEELHMRTGGRSDSRSSLHQIVSMVRSNALPREAGAKLLFLGDILNFFLTGCVGTEYTIASYSQMFNMTEGQWDSLLFKSMNIPEGLQTVVKKPGDFLGYIRKEILEKTGIQGNPGLILPAVHDTCCAVSALPYAEECAFISSGTWSLVGVMLEEPIINESTFKLQISNTGAGFDKVLFKKNIVGSWIVQKCMEAWRRSGLSFSFPEIDRMVEQAAPFHGFIDPDHPDFYNPNNMVASVVAFLEKTGQPVVKHDDIAQIMRIIYESLAMKYRQALQDLMNASGKEITRICIIGGGSNNKLLNQFTSSVTGLDVYAGPSEASSIGNILFQAYGAGEIDEEDITGLINRSFEIERYVPNDCDQWNVKYQQFMSLATEPVLNNT